VIVAMRQFIEWTITHIDVVAPIMSPWLVFIRVIVMLVAVWRKLARLYWP
jgi:hypothetical protein